MRPNSRSTRPAWWMQAMACASLGLICLAGFAGCGNSGGDGGGSGDSGGDAQAANGKSQQGDGPFVDSEGRKWLNPKIPYDVWYQDPLSVVAIEKTGGAPSEVANAGGDTPTPTPVPPMENTSAAASVDWKDVLPAAILESEVTRINNRFKEKLATVGTYNSSYLELPPHVATMAAFAEVAVETSEDVKWKANAKYVRALAASMLAEPLMAGPKFHKQVQLPAEQINEILSGAAPAIPPDTPDRQEFWEVADFGGLMKRLEIAEKWLNINVGSEESLKERGEDIIHEAHVVAALARIIQLEGYGYHDDESFLGYANPMLEAGLKMAASAKEGNLGDFELARSMMSKACTECHGEYRN